MPQRGSSVTPLELTRVAFYRRPSGLIAPTGAEPRARINLAIDGDPLGRGPVLRLDALPSSLDQMFTIIDEEALGLPPSDPARAQRLAEAIGFEQAASAIAQLAIWIDELPARAAAQLELAHEVFAQPSLVKRIELRLREGERTVVISPQQISSMHRQLILHAPEKQLVAAVTDREQIAFDGLLLASSTLAHDESVPKGPDDPRAWVPFFVKNGAFHASEPMLEAFGRVASILESGRRPSSRRRQDYCDLDAWAAEDSSITLRQQLAVAFAAFAKSGALAKGRPASGAGLLPPDFFEALADHLSLSQDGASALRDLFSEERGWFIEEFGQLERRFGLTQAEANSGYNATPFEKRPFLRRRDGAFVLWSPRALVSWVTHGFYYRALDQARKRGRRAEFQKFWGFLVEDQVRETLQSAHPEPRPIGSGRVHGEITYRKRRDTLRSPDVALDFGQDLVLVEVFSGRLTLEARVSGNAEKLFEDVSKMTIEKATQLGHRIGDYLDGLFEIPEVDRCQVQRIWPVVLTGPGLFMTEAIWDVIDEHLSGALRLPRVKPLTIIDLADLDQMAGLVHSGWSVPDLLERKVNGYRELDWRRMVADDPAMSDERSPAIVERWEKACSSMIEELGWDPEDFERRRKEGR